MCSFSCPLSAIKYIVTSQTSPLEFFMGHLTTSTITAKWNVLMVTKSEKNFQCSHNQRSSMDWFWHSIVRRSFVQRREESVMLARKESGLLVRVIYSSSHQDHSNNYTVDSIARRRYLDHLDISASMVGPINTLGIQLITILYAPYKNIITHYELLIRWRCVELILLPRADFWYPCRTEAGR